RGRRLRRVAAVRRRAGAGVRSPRRRAPLHPARMVPLRPHHHVHGGHQPLLAQRRVEALPRRGVLLPERHGAPRAALAHVAPARRAEGPCAPLRRGRGGGAVKVPWTARGPEAEGAAAPLTVDFSAGLHQGSPDASWIAPASAEEAAEAIRRARAEGRVVRFRGHGHSMNGSSLPRAGDVVLTSQALRGYCFEAPRAVTVGAGAQLWDVHTLLRERGHTLLVANDGAA